MRTTIYEYNGAKYKFNQQVFTDLFMPENLEMSRLQRKKDLIKKTNMYVGENTIEKWYKKSSTPSDINLVIKIAEYLEVDPLDLLIETDEIAELFDEANNISPDRTIAASMSNLKNWMLSDPANKSFSSSNFLMKWKAKYPNGIYYFFAFGVCTLWLCILDTQIKIVITPFVFFLLFLFTRFGISSYFEPEKAWRKRTLIICKAFEFFLLLVMLVQSITNWTL